MDTSGRFGSELLGYVRYGVVRQTMWDIAAYINSVDTMRPMVKHENYPWKISYIGKKVTVWKIAYMKFTYTKFPTENILHIFWVWKIPYMKISYNMIFAFGPIRVAKNSCSLHF